jgi:molybdopterin molybdotransferase
MLSVEEARSRILALVAPTGIETVPLARAAGRVLAEPVTARRTQPPFAASAMDGFAVRATDAVDGARFRVIGQSQAGQRFAGRLGPGEAVRIFTGAPVPDGADLVVIQEDVTRDGDRITLGPGRDAGSNIRAAGSDFAAGSILGAPRRLGFRDIALLAAMNVAEIPVRCRPGVALIATGDELAWPGDTPGPDQITSSNNIALKAMLDAAGAKAHLLPIARDTPESLASVLDLADGSDLIVTLGGASVGDHDLVQAVALARGMDLSFHKIAMRPGKPLLAGRFGTTPLVGLPGNPVSALVCAILFLRPAIDALLGLPATEPPRRQARLAGPLPANGPRAHYMRASVAHGGTGPGSDTITVADRQDSALLSVLQWANALAVRPPHAPAAAAGDLIDWIALD